MKPEDPISSPVHHSEVSLLLVLNFARLNCQYAEQRISSRTDSQTTSARRPSRAR